MTITKYLINICTSLSQIINCFILFGHPDTTVCARAYMYKDKKWYWWFAYKFFNIFFFWQQNHCKESFEEDLKRAKEVLEYLDNLKREK